MNLASQQQRDEMKRLEAQLALLEAQYSSLDIMMVEGLPPIEAIIHVQSKLRTNWLDLQLSHNSFTTNYLANIKKIKVADETIEDAKKRAADLAKKARLENLKDIISNSASIQGEIRSQIKARFAEMIAGVLAKEIGTKGLFGLAIAPIVAAGASQLFDSLVPKFAQGGEFITSGPQAIMVGDNPGGRELVQISPLSSPAGADAPVGGNITVNVSGNVMTEDFVESELAEIISESIRRGTDFGIS